MWDGALFNNTDSSHTSDNYSQWSVVSGKCKMITLTNRSGGRSIRGLKDYTTISRFPETSQLYDILVMNNGCSLKLPYLLPNPAATILNNFHF